MSKRELLVGFDGSDDSQNALTWALEEAARSGGSVRLIYAFEWMSGAAWAGPGMLPTTWPDETARQELDDMVKAAVDAAAKSHPEVQVAGEVVDGPAPLVLQERSAHAHLVVVGSRGQGGFAGLLVGSTSVALSGHAHCPVVVIRGEEALRHARTGGVVVGVDGSAHSLRALEFATAQAAQRAVPLRVLRIWAPPAPRWGPPDFDPETVAAHERGAAEESVAPVRERHPGLQIDIEIVTGSPASVLVEASRQAQLAVVGTRGRGGLRGMLLGSVSQQLIQHGHCPVAVVPELHQEQ